MDGILALAADNLLSPIILFFALGLLAAFAKSDLSIPEAIAKGIWQLMPETAIQYGLRTGPLLDVPQFDPADERFDAEAATRAAARYLGDLYRGEAQASGLLVLASYNWGTTRVRNRIRAMKENPRDRNFWALLAQSDVPAETRDYVFKIFSAAVIGEDPKLFGFEFDRPLANPQPALTGGLMVPGRPTTSETVVGASPPATCSVSSSSAATSSSSETSVDSTAASIDDVINEVAAARITASSLDLIRESGFAEYYDPLTGEPLGGGRFTWTAAMVIEILETT